MTFDEVFAGVSLETAIVVSNGKPAPPEGPTLRYRAWRSNNFSGPLKAKIDGAHRALLIEAVNEPGLVVAYTIAEGLGHTFELETP